MLPDVPPSPAVRDDRAAAQQCLEHGQPAGGVDEHVRGGQPVRHHLREPLDPHPGVTGEASREGRPERLVATGEAGDHRSLNRQSLVDCSVDVPHAPAAARDDDKLRAGFDPERRAGVSV